MICPACHRDMIIVEFKKTELDFCPKCHGAWFDKGELDLMLESASVGGWAPFVQKLLVGPAANTGERTRKCPICRKQMKKTHAGDENKLLLDACEQGDGLWFDGGEVDQLVKIIENEAHAGTGHYQVFSFMKEVFKAPAS